jgi:hypothetical protein
MRNGRYLTLLHAHTGEQSRDEASDLDLVNNALPDEQLECAAEVRQWGCLVRVSMCGALHLQQPPSCPTVRPQS